MTGIALRTFCAQFDDRRLRTAISRVTAGHAESGRRILDQPRTYAADPEQFADICRASRDDAVEHAIGEDPKCGNASLFASAARHAFICSRKGD